MSPIETLTQIIYSTDVRGPWALYLYDAAGYHSGARWFAKHVRYPKEQISIAMARRLAEVNIANLLEVRITDAGDMLVYHNVNGAQIYPQGVDFWTAVEGAQ
jgi:hypothetical protein